MIKHHSIFPNALNFNMLEVKAISNFRDFPLSNIVFCTYNYSLSVLGNSIVPTDVCTSINH